VGRLLAFGSVFGLAAASGGFFHQSWGWAALVLAWAAAVALVVVPRRPGRPELAFAGGLAVLTAWTALSAVWSQSVPSTVQEVERDLVYIAGAGAAALLFRDRAEDGVLAAAVGICAWNVAIQLHGYDHHVEGARGNPIGYPNALGLLAAIGTILALRRRRTLPALAVLVPALVLAQSQGAYLALACGIVVALRRRLAPLVALGAVAAVALGQHGHIRTVYWRAALGDARDHPLLGSGAGTFAQQWLLRRTTGNSTLDAHSLYIETLAELGAIGLAILAATLVIPFLRGRGAPLGAYAAWVVGAGVDWHWELPGVTLAGLLCGIAALPRPRTERPLATGWRVAGAAAAAAVAGFALVGLVGNRRIDQADAARRAGDEARALALARSAERWAPWASEPLAVEAQATNDAAAMRRAVARDPHDWSLWSQLAAMSTGAERRRAAAMAARLNPRGASAASG
jgi:hypothetical protein